MENPTRIDSDKSGKGATKARPIAILQRLSSHTHLSSTTIKSNALLALAQAYPEMLPPSVQRNMLKH